MRATGSSSQAGSDGLSHQKDGTRIGLPMQPQLQKVGLQRRHRAVERAAEPCDGFLAGLDRELARGRVVQPTADLMGKLVVVVHFMRAARRVERRVDVREIVDMRSVHDGKTGSVGQKYTDVRFPASVHIEAGGKVGGLHPAVKKIQQVADALRTGRLRAKDEVEVIKPAKKAAHTP